MAVAVADAGWAVAVVLGENELQISAASLAHAGAVGVNNHAFHDGIGAGWQEMFDPFNFDHTDAAGRDFIEAFPVAQSWYTVTGYFSGLENGGAVRHGNIYTIDS